MFANRFHPQIESLEDIVAPSSIISAVPNAEVPALVGRDTRDAVDTAFSMGRKKGDGLIDMTLWGAADRGPTEWDLALAAAIKEENEETTLPPMPMPPAAPPMTPMPKAPAMPAREIRIPNPDIGEPSKRPSMYKEIIIPKSAAPAIPVQPATVIPDQEQRASISRASAARMDETSTAGFLGILSAFGIVRTSKEKSTQPLPDKKSPPPSNKGGWGKRIRKAWRWIAKK
jgi:hypothetical protein